LSVFLASGKLHFAYLRLRMETINYVKIVYMTKHKYIKYTFFTVFFVGFVAIIFWEFSILEPGSIKQLFLGKNKTFAESQEECPVLSDGYQKWSCSRGYFEEFTNNFSAAAAMGEAIKLQEDGVVADCHLFGHVIGKALIEKSDFDVAEAFAACTFGCGNGCYHGVMEGAILNEADLYNAVSKIQNLHMCDNSNENNNWDWLLKRNCVHGVGHGLLAHGYLSLVEAIDACEVFGPEWESTCVGGILMENTDQYLILNLNEEQFIEAIPEVCSQFQGEESALARSCLTALSAGFLYNTGYDLRRSEELCEELQNPWQVSVCIDSIDENLTTQRLFY